MLSAEEVHNFFATKLAADAIHLAGGTANAITVNTGGNYSYGQFKQLKLKATTTIQETSRSMLMDWVLSPV